jgi:SPP1 family predicted phage head-tail adaptor
MPDPLVKKRVGKLRHRVTFQLPTEATADTAGQPVQAWADVATVWASVEPTGGREYFLGDQNRAVVTHVVQARRNTAFTPKGRFAYGARVLNVVAVLPDDTATGRVNVLCAEVTG